MTEIEFVFVLLVAVALLTWLARQLDVPYPIFLVLGGLGLGALPGIPELELEPETVFLVFVPPLVHAAGYQASPRHLVRDARPIALAAIVLVGTTIGAVAVGAHLLVDGMGWAAAFVLATVLAPTDLVAATAVFRRLGAPQRVVNLIEGENLVNDATALTFWRLAVIAAVTGSLTLGEAVVELLLVAGGGIAIGLLGGWLVAKLRNELDDPLVEITVSLFTPYLLFIAAEQVEASGIMAAVVSGLYLGVRDSSISGSATRLQAFGFWRTLVFLLESLLFVLVGLQFPGVLDDLSAGSAGELLLVGVALSVVIMAVRMLHQFTVLELDERLGRRMPIGWRDRVVVGWSGMRGAVSLAVALAVPLELDDGTPFPARDEIIFLTIVVITVTLVVQGLTLPALIRRLRFSEEVPDARRQAMARFSTVEAALERIAQLGFSGDLAPDVLERARSMYAQRAGQLAGECRDGIPSVGSDTAGWLRLRLELLEVERTRLIQLRDDGRITSPLHRAVEQDLDLEVQRLERRLETT